MQEALQTFFFKFCLDCSNTNDDDIVGATNRFWERLSRILTLYITKQTDMFFLLRVNIKTVIEKLRLLKHRWCYYALWVASKFVAFFLFWKQYMHMQWTAFEVSTTSNIWNVDSGRVCDRHYKLCAAITAAKNIGNMWRWNLYN